MKKATIRSLQRSDFSQTAMRNNDVSFTVQDIMLSQSSPVTHTCIFCLKISSDWYPISTYHQGLPIHCGYKVRAIQKRGTDRLEDICTVSHQLCVKTERVLLSLNRQLFKPKLFFFIINALWIISSFTKSHSSHSHKGKLLNRTKGRGQKESKRKS